MKIFLAIIVHIVSAVLSSPLSAQAPATEPIEQVYEVAFFGTPLGTIEVVREQKQAGETVVNHQSVAVTIDFEDKGKPYSVAVQSQIAYDDTGLREFSHSIRENDKHYSITGRRVEDKLWVRAEQIRTRAQQENKALSDTAVSVASQAVPYLDLVAGLLSSSDSDGSTIIRLSDFDVSSDELYDELSSLEPGSGERRYRVFNTETLEIDPTIIRALREESVSVGDRTHRCLVVSMESRNHTRTACIARDALGGYLVTETGRDEDGPYRVSPTDRT